MELRYTFDSARFQLGTLCKRGHAWPGTNQSLRIIHPTASACVGCKAGARADWLFPFVDQSCLGLPNGTRLGRSCKAGHYWNGFDYSLRKICNGHCVECARLREVERSRAKPRKTEKRWDPELRGLPPAERRRLYKAKLRERNKKQGLTTRGTAPVRADALLPAEEAALHRAIRAAGRLPSVARLVMDEQRRYWAENPEAKAEHDRQWAQASWWLTYQTRPDLRLYHREKSRRRKARDRGATAVQVSAAAIRQRFNEFGNSCAYCGAQGDMEIEHVVATSQGGAHDIGNIVPACSRCNTSKRTTEMERWYRTQPFFSELRLRRIRRVLHAPMGHQLALALC